MKTTIKLARCSSLTVEPGQKCVKLGLHGITDTVAVLELTPDQVGAMLFAIECAADAANIAQDRQGIAA